MTAQNPSGKFTPANAVADGIPWGGDADTWKMIADKLYIFGGQGSKDAFDLDEQANLAQAVAQAKAAKATK
jgi:hypothetical protein